MRKLALIVLLLVIAMTAFAQGDRGTLTGIVADPANAMIPAAKITAKNTETGAVFEGQSTQTGDFTIPALPAGIYDVTIEAPGFSKKVLQGVRIQVAQGTRVDVSLAVGATTDSVTVTGETAQLKTQNAEISTNISGEKFVTLPLTMSGAVRNWLSFATLAPGVNGDFGANNSTSVNGLPGGRFKILVEGMDVTSSNDITWTSTVAASSVEAIAEFSLQTSNFSAQYNGGLGAQFNFTTKSGANKVHGSLYNYMTNETMLNAHRHFQASRRDRDRKTDLGGTVGGPIWIPKLYNGKDKTFFFVGFERFSNKTVTYGNLGTVPTAAFLTGDFSRALTTTQVGTYTPAGGSPQAIIQNTIYDPRTQTSVNGVQTRTPFAGNIIPASLLDPVALKMQALFPKATNNDQINNYLYDQPNPRDQILPSIKLDHNINDNTKASFYWSYQTTHDVPGNDPLPYPISAKRDKTARGHTYRLNLDRTISPTFVLHLGAGFLRFSNPDSSTIDSLGYDAVAGLGLKGATVDPSGFPRVTGLNTGNYGGMGFNMGPTNANDYWNDKLNFVADATYIRGSHTYKVGGLFNNEMWSDRNTRGAQGTYAFSNNQTSNPAFQGLTYTGGTPGFNYASFLLGMTDNSQVNAVQDPQWRKNNFGFYAEDNWKASRKLTLQLGVRWEFGGAGHEIHYRNSMFGPNTPNPTAGNLRGAIVYEGYGPGRCDCSFTDNYNKAVSPRLSGSYQLDEKTVIRAGWGLSYGPGPTWAYLTNRTQYGVGFDVFSVARPAESQAATFLKDGLVYDRAKLYTPTLNPGLGFSSPDQTPANLGNYYDRGGGRPERINQWNISIEREIFKNMTIDLAYVGNRGVWETQPNLSPLNANTPQRLAQFGLSLDNAADRALLIQNISTTAVLSRFPNIRPYAAYPTARTLAQVLRPYPFLTGGITPQWAPLGSSWYDSLQVKFTKRYANGLDLTSSFTWGKALRTGENVNDAFNRVNQKAMANDNRPLTLVVAFNYRTPLVSSNKLVRQALGNWIVGGILRYTSGTMIQVPGSNTSNLGNYIFQNTRYNRVNGVSPIRIDPGCHCIDPNKDTALLDPAAWSDPAQGQWGFSSPTYSDYRWVRSANEQMTIGRTFPLQKDGKLAFEFRIEMFNAFNRVTLPAPTSGNPTQAPTFSTATATLGMQNGGYGFINTLTGINGARTGQMVGRITF